MPCEMPKLEGSVVVPTGGWAFTLREAPSTFLVGTVAAGTYKASTLVAALQTAFNDAGNLTYAVTIDDDAVGATSVITTSVASGTFLFYTMATGMRLFMGIDALSASLAASVVGDVGCPYVWCPKQMRGPGLCPNGSVGMPVALNTLSTSYGGVVKSLSYGELAIDVVRFSNLPGSSTWDSLGSAADGTTFESFWRAVMMNTTTYPTSTGKIDYHADRSVDGTYVSWQSRSVGKMPVSPTIAEWTSGAASLWNVEFDVSKHVDDTV